VPVVVTGFEPRELMLGLLRCVQLLEAGTPAVHNAYAQVVREHGNPGARALLRQVFEVIDQPWRGLGVIPGGGLALRQELGWLDARRRFGLPLPAAFPSAAEGECIAAQILQGRATPPDCQAFGGRCTPEHPLGAPMVSSEGACAAYHRYRPAGAEERAARAPA
jgi:hydrogenase expression/formation protein HypD